MKLIMKKTGSKKKALTAVILFLVSGGLRLLAELSDTFASFYTANVYSVLVGTIGRFSGLFPFALSELLLYLVIAGTMVMPLRIGLDIRRNMPGSAPLKQVLCFLSRTVLNLLLGFSVILLIYMLNCGINYHAGTFSKQAGMQVRQYSLEELDTLCVMLAEKVNETAAIDARHPAENRLTGMDLSTKSSWRKTSRAAMIRLGEAYPQLSGYYPLPKPLLFSRLLSVQQVTGIYSPFAIEAVYNREMPDYNVPHTLCHELSHLRGYMHEDEANFISYLACIGSDLQTFRYSGYLTAWVYAGNALAKQDRKRYNELRAELCPEALSDLEANNAFWDRFDGEIAEVHDKVNDAYLKGNGQREGVISYNRFVELLLAYYSK